MDERTDVALVKISATNLPAITIGDSNKVRVGEWVVAIGSPFGLDNTVTAGIVSAKGRDTGDYLPFIQTDVAVNPGNSGGPLINMPGEVIGINSQIYSRTGGFMGISFAIPIDEAMRVADQLKTSGKVVRGRIAVAIGEVTKDVADSLGLPKAQGALVSQRRTGRSGRQGRRAAGRHHPEVQRPDRRDRDRSAAHGRRHQAGHEGDDDDLAQGPDARSADHDRRDAAGQGREDRAEEAAAAEGAREQRARPGGERHSGRPEKGAETANGVQVDAVEGPAARAGFQKGDIILRVGDTDITSAKQFEEVAQDLDAQQDGRDSRAPRRQHAVRAAAPARAGAEVSA